MLLESTAWTALNPFWGALGCVVLVFIYLTIKYMRNTDLFEFVKWKKNSKKKPEDMTRAELEDFLFKAPRLNTNVLNHALGVYLQRFLLSKEARQRIERRIVSGRWDLSEENINLLEIKSYILQEN